MRRTPGQLVSIPPAQTQFAEDDELTEEDGCWTDLQLAAKDGNLEKVKILVSQGADINAPATGYYGNTALQVCRC